MSFLYSIYGAIAGAVIMFIFSSKTSELNKKPTLQELTDAYRACETQTAVQRVIPILCPSLKDEKIVRSWARTYYKGILEDDYCIEL